MYYYIIMFVSHITQIDRGNPRKLYLQLLEILEGKLESGEWSVEMQIPTEEELCHIYDVSKATVRQAVSALARQGYLRRQQGKGTFVCKRVIADDLSFFTSFREQMFEAGVNFATKVLVKTTTMPTEDLALNLETPDDRHLVFLRRLRTVDGEPILLEEAFLPLHVCPGLLDDDIERDSLFDLLKQKYGIHLTKVRRYIGLTHLTREEAELLELQEGAPALLLTQYFYVGEEQVMYSRAVKRSDRFQFFIELEKKPL